MAIVPSAATAEQPPLLRSFCPTGQAGGQCIIPRGIGVDEASGETYIADQVNRRVEKFTAWGELLLAWGWDVVAAGPGEKGGGFEICVRADGDVCKSGVVGSGDGQFGGFGPQGVAVDSEGDVYVVDWLNHRVQKFGPEGEFLLSFGGNVNKTKVEAGAPDAERNRCPVDPGDECQAGVEGTGNGQFGSWPLGSYIAIDRKGTETAADDAIYVGDQGRVQAFDRDGDYVSDLPDPDGVLAAGGAVNSLALEQGSGDLYLGFATGVAIPESKANVRKLNAAGELECTIEAHNPSAIAVGAGGEVYVVEGGFPPATPREISRYEPDCAGREVLFGPGEDEFTVNPTGIATSSACREAGEEATNLLIANPDETNSFVKLFGPPPNATLCPPPPKPPLIAEQFAASVGPEGAVVRARINPRFWPDTAYYVQYGTAQCLQADDWEAACVKAQPAAPGILLTEETVNALITSKGLFLGADEALQPDTTYRYRFVAQSGFQLGTPNGPVFGQGGGEEVEADVYVVEGQSSAFHTPPLPPEPKLCPNQAFRTGPSAPLPDCRAYEMVSPLAKNNGDLFLPREEVLFQAAADGEAATFPAGNAFSESPAAPAHNHYLAERGAGGWSAHSINALRDSVSLVFGENIAPRFKAFGEDLCSGWLMQDTDVPLVGGAVPRGVVNLYRDRGLRAGCAPPAGYQLLTTVFPPGFDPAVEKTDSQYYPELQGFSGDGEISVYRAPAALSADACQISTGDGPQGRGIYQVYLSQEGQPGVAPRLISVLPGGGAVCADSSVGTAQGFAFSSFNTRQDSLHHAVSEDGSLIYWSIGSGGIYLRLNAGEPQSALQFGGANGKGDLIGPAAGTGNTKSFGEKNKVTQVEITSGQFTVGQGITDSAGNIPPGTTIVAIEEEPPTPKEIEDGKEKSGRFVLTLSANATGTKTDDELTGLASEVVSDLLTESGAFQAGQTITGPSIPLGTTIVSCAPECGATATSLTLSAKATQSQADAPLEGSSPCTEADAACTLPVSAEAEALSGTSASRYLDGAADGSVAFFSTGGDLYEYDLAKALGGEEATSPIAGEVEGVVGASEDGSLLYLLSNEDLDEGAVAGKPNLYLYRRGVGIEFVATLGGKDDASFGNNNAVSSSIAAFPYKRTSRVSPDGLHMAFTSTDPALAAAVAEYENLDAQSGVPTREIYLYDASAGSLVCVSCNPSGARPTGRATEQPNSNPDSWVWSAARLPGWTTAMHTGQLLTADGGRLFFESFEPLVGRDTNGRGDVYEWERAEDKAECLGAIGGELFVAASGGCLSLISSAQAGSDAQLADVASGGDDVFFVTDASLVAQDTDQFRDLYDARVGGGFPPPPPPVPPCEGDGCQNPPAPPQAPTPGSMSFEGQGNVVPGKGRCPKGKRRVVRRGKVRCLPRKRGARGKKAQQRRAGRAAR